MAQDTKDRLFEPPPAPKDDANHESVAALFAGTYEVHERLAWNGLALVYRVRSIDGKDGHEERAPGGVRAVALLPIDCESKPALLRPFETKTVQLIAHTDEHTVATLDAEVRHGVPYLLLPYSECKTLAEELTSGGPMLAWRAIGIALDVLRALSAAHARGLRHWDLTPSNVLLSKGAAGEEVVRVLAVGLAPIVRAMSDSDMTGPTGKGSGPSAAKYLAPELLYGGTSPSDERADLYAVGALLVTMLTGKRPSAEKAVPAEVTAVKGLAGIIRRAMAKDPAVRFATADEFITALASSTDDVVTVPVASKAPRESDAAATPAGNAVDELVTVPVVSKAPPAGGPRLAQPAGVTIDELVTVPVVSKAPPASAPAAPLPASSAQGKTNGVGVLAGIAAVVVFAGVAYWMATRPAEGGPATTIAPPAPDAAPVADAAADSGARAVPIADSAARAVPIADTAVVSVAVADTGTDAGAVAAPVAAPIAAPVAAPVADTGAAPLTGELPAPLDSLFARVEHGDRLTAAELGPLYGYVGRNGGDVRGHLLLARAFKNLRWSDDIVARYAIALRVDAAAAKRDPQILADLVDLAARDDDPTAPAARLVAATWGAAALPVIEAQLAQTTRPELIGRLRRLRGRVAAP